MNLLLTLLLVATGGVTTSAPHWQWPVDPPRVVTRPYLAPATPYAAGHRGIDVEASSTEVYAPADGIVHFAGFVVDRPLLSIRHAGGLLSSFEPVSTTLAAGDQVRRGQVIGTLEPGHCRVVLCLHFGLRLGGEYVSPLLMLGGVPRSVLLPTRRLSSAAYRNRYYAPPGFDTRFALNSAQPDRAPGRRSALAPRGGQKWPPLIARRAGGRARSSA